ncbi:NAD(P)-dependent oxidoreductase [Streptomyces sp. AN091965]|uniref:NAD(P)-dependent oxidoreductase n=1 Tax=Streptomyces sp. AN091965 TaxID=2927803 RepID=UPI001F623F85|nr:NAD(P)H-binding protein [Streptomyces sp. AN091965]MCI3932436.1 NAD(P)H-binding protein [Streptomyces sp. AN091965]
MRITVFGASGGIGGEIVRQGLAAGHEVTAVVRDPARLAATGDRLEVFRSGLTDPEELRGAVAGRDAVLSGLGARGREDARAGIATRLTVPVLRAMEAEGVRRLLVVSAAPLAPAAEREPLADRAMMAVVSRVLKPVYADLRVLEGELARSATDWTSVRPPRLLDKPLTGVYRTAVGRNPRGARQIGRADVAHAMLTMIDDPATVKQGVGVAY